MRFSLNHISLGSAAFLCIFVAIALQIQITLSLYPDHVGLRLNLADIVLPFAGLVILTSLLLKKSAWPQWKIKHIYLWLGAISLIFIASFFQTYFLFEQWSTWAFVNKITGWFVLVSYFCLGGWIATNYSDRLISLTLKALFYFFLITATILITATFIQNFTPVSFRPWVWYPLEGFMANRNAYAFLFLTILGLVTMDYLRGSQIFSKRLIYLFWGLAPFTLILNDSRAMMLSIIIFIPVMIFTHWQKEWRRLFLFSLIGAFFFLGTYGMNMDKLFVYNVQKIGVVKEAFKVTDSQKIEKLQKEIDYHGDNIRLKVLEDSFELLRERPLLGSGLGSLFIYQKEKRGEVVTITDNTALWLWVETGLPGLLVFLCFYFIIVKQLWQNRNSASPVRNTLSLSIFWMLIAFALMSQFHELLYSRFLWFFLGLTLASQALNQNAETTASADQKPDFEKTA